MSAKKSKSKSSKSTKAKPAAAKKVAKAKPAAAVVPAEVASPVLPTGNCPKGGDHEWSEENGERFCSKCKEPEGKTAKAAEKPSREGKQKKVSAIDAAAQLLAEVGMPMNCVEMIEAMATKGLWASPGGKTPHATLYSAIIREIGLKGNEARFVKAERGRFTIKA
ncbi:winged helix-turn-helix domain-containing protein [Anatilimnocola sp. NA78]|uniref:winged helix-turn-helix domain-containing protein n=1 Tax=Anatilimnocola sp. NA78 TaxID=3415683 RepID=UPI003CE55CED